MNPPGEDPVRARRASFLSAGEDYDRARPGYPVEAVSWVVGEPPSQVIDLGSGPGKLTSQLTELGHEAVGVDPSMKMLQRTKVRGLRAICGVAEALPFKTASADVVTAAQAFHWFDHHRAVSEMRRVLRRHGRMGLLWNLRDESVEWVAALSTIIGSEDAIGATLGSPDELEMTVKAKLAHRGLFGPLKSQVFAFNQQLDAEGLVALIGSRSYVAILGDAEKRKVLSEVRRLCREHPQLRDRSKFELPYKTVAFRAAAVQ